MNKERRLRIERVISLIDEAYQIVTEVYYDEDSAYDNLPENFQNSERGEKILENIARLEEIKDTLEETSDNLCEVKEG